MDLIQPESSFFAKSLGHPGMNFVFCLRIYANKLISSLILILDLAHWQFTLTKCV
jgi:hypothetical protein